MPAWPGMYKTGSPFSCLLMSCLGEWVPKTTSTKTSTSQTFQQHQYQQNQQKQQYQQHHQNQQQYQQHQHHQQNQQHQQLTTVVHSGIDHKKDTCLICLSPSLFPVKEKKVEWEKERKKTNKKKERMKLEKIRKKKLCGKT